MQKKFNLKVGQKVSFRPTHNKHLELKGTVTAVSDDHDLATVKADADGKAIEVAREFQAHASDCTVIADAHAAAGDAA